jgi:hypothetical protein
LISPGASVKPKLFERFTALTPLVVTAVIVLSARSLPFQANF